MEHNHHHKEVSNMEELMTLLEYMKNHNEEHTIELEELSEHVVESEDPVAYGMIEDAIRCYKEGNVKLEEALNLLKGRK